MNDETIQPMTWVEIKRSALKHNFEQIRSLAADNQFKLPKRQNDKRSLTNPEHFLAVIKADAYGHGMKEVAAILDRAHTGYFGVASISEAIELRKTGVKQPILIFENTLKEYAQLICEYDLTPTVCTHELAHALNREAHAVDKQIKVHIKVDTGMGRLGIWHKDAFKFIEQVSRFRNIVIHGIYTHFPVADTDKKFTQKQLLQLKTLVKQLDTSGIVVPYIHASNSMGLAGYQTSILNVFRPGLMLYGEYPSQRLRKKIDLKPVMSVHSRIIFLKDIERGRSISYGRTFIAKRSMTVATIPIGYKDGYQRSLSNKAYVLIKGKKCKILGRVTMDQIVVDVTRVKLVSLGTPVTIMGGEDKQQIRACDLAKDANTISYELMCALGNNLPRIYT